ncbi:MAG: hypothetical protein WAT74_07385 [Flavobacteriales bacterium]
MKQVPDIRFEDAPVLVAEEAVLSPESCVFVALMSVEEGPNKASFMVVKPDIRSVGESVA